MLMDRLLTRLKALADETRLKIIVVLLNYDLCVGALARHLEISKQLFPSSCKF